jgi:putative ATP-dependent endonuclease of OLD family
MQEHDPVHEVVIYCVEEPEAHLHPHQQRSLASYLIDKIPGQTIVTTHSPAIVANYSPESVIRLVCSAGETHAANKGCSKCIKDSWEDMGYRISILPAEAFFASAVLLVEGPSEMIFYHALAKSLNIELDFYNISILSVDGVQFEVYASILDALEIPYALRTDNDISDITLGSVGNKYEARNLAGMNRALTLAKQKKMLHVIGSYTQHDSVGDGIWSKVCGKVEPSGVFLSKIDLEHDLGDELPAELIAFKGPTVQDCVNYLQDKKAIRMRQFIKLGPLPARLKTGKLAGPLNYCVDVVKSKMGI